MSERSDVLFAGSSGLIGRLALSLLLSRAQVQGFKVFAPLRHAPVITHPQLVPVVGAFDGADSDARIESALQEHNASLGTFACALGTTMAQAGSQAAFAAVDRDLVLHLAALALRHGSGHAVVVSSVGADARARNFYLRTKGRMERDLSGLEFARCDFLHPGLLLGDRDGRDRRGESLAQKLSPIYNPLLAGPLRRYRSISANAVANALVQLCMTGGEGVHSYEFDALNALAVL